MSSQVTASSALCCWVHRFSALSHSSDRAFQCSKQEPQIRFNFETKRAQSRGLSPRNGKNEPRRPRGFSSNPASGFPGLGNPDDLFRESICHGLFFAKTLCVKPYDDWLVLRRIGFLTSGSRQTCLFQDFQAEPFGWDVRITLEITDDLRGWRVTAAQNKSNAGSYVARHDDSIDSVE